MIDRRVIVRLQDSRYGVWPLLAKLNVAADRELLTALRKASKRK